MHRWFSSKHVTTFAVAICVISTARFTLEAATLGVDADSYVQNDAASVNTNFGSSSVLQVKFNNTPEFHRKSYLRFDAGGAPALGYGSATLNLTVDTHSATASGGNNWAFSVYGLNDGHAGENWGEGTITWNNAPANTAAGNAVVAADVFNGAALATFSLVDGGVNGSTVSLDASAFPDLLDFLNSDTNGLMSFIIVRDTIAFGSQNVIHEFRSKENSTGGGATLTFELVVPEPTSIALWSTAAVALCGSLWWQARRRKRLS